MKRSIVDGANFESVISKLSACLSPIAFDTEARGLRSYHGDTVFSLSFAFGEESFYLDVDSAGAEITRQVLDAIFMAPARVVFIHNAKFDLAMLMNSFGFPVDKITATIHCTRALARLEYNDHQKYSLEACAERIGFKKDDRVKEWILANKKFTWEDIPGKLQRKKSLHFDQVPFEMISEYAMIDAEVCLALGLYQVKRFEGLSLEAIANEMTPISRVVANELQLIRTTFTMEASGLKIDLPYARLAVEHQQRRMRDAVEEFEFLTGEKFKVSSKVFEKVFAQDEPSWGFTEKGNPSFDSEHLSKFKSPAAMSILEYRDAKSKADFFLGFEYHVDARGFVHPNFNPFGTATGRFSSDDPNFQNLTSEEDESDPFPIRRAIVTPAPDYFIVSIDYVAMEYIMLLELAARMTGAPSELLLRVRAGADVHQATADLALQNGGVEITRKAAKMTNFLTIYGGGDNKLATGLSISLEEAKKIRAAIFKGCPDIKRLMDAVSKTADHRKKVFNWLGRISHFPDYRFCYKALNYLIQGGCADIMKVAMNRIQDYISSGNLSSRLVMTIHDELVFYVHSSEAHHVPMFAKIMEEAFPHEFIPMRVSIEASGTDLESLIPWEEFKVASGF